MRLLLAPAISLLLGSSLFAQTSGLDVKGMLQSLQDITQKQTDSSKHQLAQTIADFSAAAADDGSALNFYIEAVRVTRFVGQADADTAFRDWQKNEVPRLNPVAIRIALRYTIVTLQRAAGATDDQIFPVLLAYAEDAENTLPAIYAQENQANLAAQGGGAGGMAGQGGAGEQGGYGTRGRGFRNRNNGPGQTPVGDRIIGEDVSQNIFSRWYNIGPQMAGLQSWEYVPEYVDSMYTQFLLPYMRKYRDPRLLQYWDNKIITEKGRASAATAAFNTDRYNLTVRPALLWSRAEDEIVIGQRDQGITDMYNLVKTFPAHPDAGKWIPELKGLLTTPPAVAAGGNVAFPTAPAN
jgi:hypothetical protein